jgi:DNA helicase-2/ATP-dependent DNA helicase PcrA
MDLTHDLNPQQIEAVTHVDGPLLVLAGAGSGKTRVITRRVAHLISQGISPRNILAITFTNKAAGEMKERIAHLVPDSRVWISTFHKLCARLLRIHGELVGLRDGYVIYDTTDRLKVIRDCLARIGLDRAQWPPERIENAMSRAKNDLLDPVAYSEKASDYFQINAARVYRAYQEQLLHSNAVDFDDLLLHVAILLRDNPSLRAALDERYRFILVDEYQDTNLAQYAILRCLSTDHANLCATGDPDQSIYGWRGANIKNILKFEHDYPGTRVVRLEKNYRSTKRILAAASRLIRFNTKRKPKDLVTDNADGLPVAVECYANERDEAQSIALCMREAVESGRRQYGDFAVFCRISALTRNVETAFSIAQVPYQVLSGVAFYERAEVKDLLAYLKLIVNSRDDVAFERIVNVPARGIGNTTIEHLQAAAARTGEPLFETARDARNITAIKPRQADALVGFVRLIDELAAMKHHCVAEVMRQVLDRTDFFGDRDEQKKRKRAPLPPPASNREGAAVGSDGPYDDADAAFGITDERRANVEELLSAAHQFDLVNPDAGVDQFLAESILATDLDAWDSSRQAVSLMTLHAAKGLEFPVVFIVAVEHGILPHERSRREAGDVEEERRLMFVGMTRAKEELYLSHVTSREFRGTAVRAIPSQFLMELAPAESADRDARPPKPPSRPASGLIRTAADLAGIPAAKPRAEGLREGMLVCHPNYGLGRITSLAGYGDKLKATIKFTTGSTKTFMVKESGLQPVKSRS